MRAVLALAWGLLAAAPLLREAARCRVVSRARGLRSNGFAAPKPQTLGLGRLGTGEPAADRSRGPGRSSSLAPFRRRRDRREAAELEAELPLAADLLAVAVGAGLTPYLALRVAARSGPPAVSARLASVVAVADGDEGLAGALELEAGSSPALRPLLEVLLASERLGAPVGPVLARLAADGRARARRAALARARSVPVRLLFPLVFLVLPAFLLLTVAPVLLAGLAH